jgi:hypothetical protein
MALGLAGTAGAAAATAPATGAKAATLVPESHESLSGPQTTVLPDGDRLLITGTGPAASVVVQAPGGRTVPAVRYAPDSHHTYVIPASVLAHPAQQNVAQYQIPALSTAAAPAATPYYPLSILQINAVGLDGKPADAFTFLTDVDDTSKWNIPLPVSGGVERVAVPTGHYSATTIFSAFDPATGIGTLHVVSQLDLTVAAGGVTTLNPDERAATAQIQATAPRPTTTDFEDVLYSRTDAKGVTSTLGVSNSGTVFVTPTTGPQVGSFGFQLLAWGGSSPAGAKEQYRYDVMFPGTDHVDSNQNYTVDASKLTTTHNIISTDPGETSHQGEYMMGPVSPTIGGVQQGHLITVPADLITYTGQPLGDQQWMASVIPALPSASAGFPAALMFSQGAPVYQGKTEVWHSWAHGPLTPQVGQFTYPAFCNACSEGGTVDLGLTALTDSNPDSSAGFMGPATGHFTVYRDGAQVFSQDNTSGTELTGQAQTPGTYRMVFDLDLSQFPITQSTVSHTDITVPYSPAPDPKSALPSADFCQAQGTSTTPCSILPVLNLNYQLATDGFNTSHGTVTPLLLTVGHQSYGTAGSQAPVTGATVSVSYDKGATWTAAPVVTAGAGHFVALLKNAAAKGATPWLKVTASDALGGSITQTVANAYTIG